MPRLPAHCIAPGARCDATDEMSQRIRTARGTETVTDSLSHTDRDVAMSPAYIGVTASVTICNTEPIERSVGKAKRVFDKRGEGQPPAAAV